RLDLVAQVLVVRRQRDLLAQELERLVDRETRPDRRDLEQDAARLAEVDGLEIEAVDHRGRVRSGLQHTIAPGLLLVRWARPGNMMHRAGSLDARLGRRWVVGIERTALLAAHLPLVLTVLLESKRFLEQSPARIGARAVRPDRVEPAD